MVFDIAINVIKQWWNRNKKWKKGNIKNGKKASVPFWQETIQVIRCWNKANVASCNIYDLQSSMAVPCYPDYSFYDDMDFKQSSDILLS